MNYTNRSKFSHDLSKVFTSTKMPEAVPSLPAYPPKVFLAGKGIYAYLVQFMTSHHECEATRDFIAGFFPTRNSTPVQETILTNQDGDSIHVSNRNEFNGVLFDLITNSSSFLNALDTTHIKLPPPWVAFPRITDPDILGSLQGDIEYWWDCYWSPYWNALSDSQRLDYLRSVDASKAWVDCIEAHRSKH